MILNLIRIFAILCALAGCSVIQQKVEMDASTAATIAANAGDTAGAACFKALEPVVGTAPAGLLSKFEVARAGQIVNRGRPVRTARRRAVPASVGQGPGDTLTAVASNGVLFLSCKNRWNRCRTEAGYAKSTRLDGGVRRIMPHPA